MPTANEERYYEMGFLAGIRFAEEKPGLAGSMERRGVTPFKKTKRKLSAWNKFVKANSRKKEFRYRDGKLNLKKMGVAFRRKKRR